MMNRSKIGLRKDLLKEFGILLLKETDLNLDKAQPIVNRQEITLVMTHRWGAFYKWTKKKLATSAENLDTCPAYVGIRKNKIQALL